MTTKALEPQEVTEELRGGADGRLDGPVHVYYTMLLARALSERMWVLARQPACGSAPANVLSAVR